MDRLTDVKVRTFIRQAREGRAPTRKLSDGGGLYVMLTPKGTPVWRMNYTYAGRYRTLAFGQYPEVTLAEARERRAAARSQLRDGRDPAAERRVERATTATASVEHTFDAVADAWLSKRKPEWSDIHYRQTRRALERDVYPALGKLPVDRITPAMVATVVRGIMSRGANETAAKVRWNLERIFDYAQVFDGTLLASNPAVPARQVLTAYRKYTPRPALLDARALADVLRKAEAAPLTPAVRMCHRLIAFTAARVGNAVAAKWADFDLAADVPCWTIPREEMKVRGNGKRLADHRVILGPTIAGELQRWRTVTGAGRYLFPPPYGNKPTITREALEKAYRKTLALDGVHSVHGWRASLSTLARDAGFSRDVVEIALDHIHDNETVRAYDRGQRLSERVKLARWWDAQLTAGAVVR